MAKESAIKPPPEMDRLMTPATAQGSFFCSCGQTAEGEKMDSYLELPIGEKAPEIVTAIVEVPQDSVNKYEYDLDLKVFVLDRNLHSPIHYPGDYGFITQTIAQDGDPLDILVLGDVPSFTGCLCKVRPLGLFEMLDNGVCDEKIIAYGPGNPRYIDLESYTDILPHILREIEHFFAVYKDLEATQTRVLGWKDRDAAHAVIQSSHKRFNKKYASK
jgi:inorganic pyrophosphatase